MWVKYTLIFFLTNRCCTKLLHMSLYNRGVSWTVSSKRGIEIGPDVIRWAVSSLRITLSHLSIPVWQLWMVPVDVFTIKLWVSIPSVVEGMDIVVWRRKPPQFSFQIFISGWLQRVIHFDWISFIAVFSRYLIVILSIRKQFDAQRAAERWVVR